VLWHRLLAGRDDGVGLAAPQVGVNVRMMVFNPFGRERPGSETILVNPEIVSVSPTTALMEEGCLSFPKLYARVTVGDGVASVSALSPAASMNWVSTAYSHACFSCRYFFE
jgi:peptide deformylase